MRRYILLLTNCLLLLTGYAQSTQNTYWQQQVNYTIKVSLNDAANTLDGSATIEYINHSPDSLSFIWIHLWPNAYKNDKTAYSEQKLLGNQTNFYFSNENERGYINRLDFKVDGVSVLVEDHPQYIDIVKLVLPKPLPPGSSVSIHTPFHVQVPYEFSRLGHAGQFYSITQWYPKAAVYDRSGWHPMPYLEWGEYYNDFGDYTVDITLPANYVVGATGMLQSDAEKEWMKGRTKPVVIPKVKSKKKELFPTEKKQPEFPKSDKQTKTLVYKATNVTDFAWFADKRFIVKYDTVQLNNKVVEAWNFVIPAYEKTWINSMKDTKRAIHFYSGELGAYPYPQASVVCDAVYESDGMEYPMITHLNCRNSSIELGTTIAHEIGHNWLQGILATNERQNPWMDEGMNTYYERKYTRLYYPDDVTKRTGIEKKFPADETEAMLDLLESKHIDQPIAAESEAFPYTNYTVIPYTKTALWLEKLEADIGKDAMKKMMQAYYDEWKFKHPYPEDFKKLAEQQTGRSLEQEFKLLHQTGPLVPPKKRNTRVTGLFNFRNTHETKYIGLAPAIGFNNYDKAEIGLLIHNYNVPASPFQFVAIPMFATNSKQLVGLGRAGYTWYPKGGIKKAEIYASAARFNFDDGSDIDDQTIFKSFRKITPGIYLEWKQKKANSTVRKWIDFHTWFISEQRFESTPKPAPADTLYYDAKAGAENTVIPQITLGWANDRVLYPWSAELAIQQVKQIVRTTITAKYFLNYNAKGQGIAVRLFAGKIFYTQSKTDLLRSDNSRYHFTMYGPNGYQDYTYSNAFADRNQSTEIFGRQIMIRDGGFKYRSDFSSVQAGLKTNGIDFFDNWLAATNIEIDIPNKINPLSVLPFKVPLKVFADIGTSASPWTTNSEQSKFLYSIGFQLQILKFLTVYYPLIQSKEFKEPNSVNDPTREGGPSWWQKKLTFSIDITPLKPKVGGVSVL